MSPRPTLFVTLFLLFLVTPTFVAADANVFVYHRFGDSRYPSTNTSLSDFEAHLEILKEGGYSVLTLGEIVSRLRRGDDLPEKCASITVDDGYDTFLSGATPLLKRYGYPATLFVSTSMVGHAGYLGWNDLRRLAAERIEIGNHSHEHHYYHDRLVGEGDNTWRRRVGEDIRRAQKLFKKELGITPILFAYPFGEYSSELIDIVKDVGFIGAALQTSGVVSDDTDLYELPRFPMGGAYADPEVFREKVRMKALLVDVLSPKNTVMTSENPPTLRLRIKNRDADLARMKFFVDDKEGGTIIRNEGDPSVFIIRANEPLKGRRSRYTLTAPSIKNGDWFWFSRLWLNPQGKEF